MPTWAGASPRPGVRSRSATGSAAPATVTARSARTPAQPAWTSGMDCPAGETVALLGGVYSNHLALAGALRDARVRGAEAIYCLGDLGAFGPHPDRVFPLLEEFGVRCLQGNYDHSLGN